MSNKFEQLLELLINEENDKAESLFHEIVVEKSRDIYEGLAETKDEEETREESKEETVGEQVELADESKDETVEEESIEEVGGDATDELIKDISAEEEGDADMAVDGDEEVAGDEEGDVEDRVVDLEDALDELKAEFEKMMSGDKGEDSEEDGEEEAEEAALAPVEAQMPFEAKHDMKKEKMDEYKIQKSADNSDKSDKSAKSPVAAKGGKEPKADAKNIAQTGAEDKGRPAPTAEKMGEFENTGGKDKSTSFKKEAKAETADKADNKKSPVASK